MCVLKRLRWFVLTFRFMICDERSLVKAKRWVRREVCCGKGVKKKKRIEKTKHVMVDVKPHRLAFWLFKQ